MIAPKSYIKCIKFYIKTNLYRVGDEVIVPCRSAVEVSKAKRPRADAEFRYRGKASGNLPPESKLSQFIVLCKKYKRRFFGQSPQNDIVTVCAETHVGDGLRTSRLHCCLQQQRSLGCMREDDIFPYGKRFSRVGADACPERVYYPPAKRDNAITVPFVFNCYSAFCHYFFLLLKSASAFALVAAVGRWCFLISVIASCR